ncbi:transcriptional regulator [Novosphingobium sp. BL-8A]|uniref:3'-5' exonuclease n=1 Tax=Novosphingobium sp. BL-8A TaxID=3127639 RepID=UPI003757B65C
MPEIRPKAFLDFEASSLAQRSHPIEVAWVFEDGSFETFLIRPAPNWTDWAAEAEAIHGIPHETLISDGTALEEVAARMMARLAGHDLLASAPSWDGKWLSTLLRAAGQPRHALRLRDSDDAFREAAEAILQDVVTGAELSALVADILARTEVPAGMPRAHRALPDAQAEWRRWLDVKAMATKMAAEAGN